MRTKLMDDYLRLTDMLMFAEDEQFSLIADDMDKIWWAMTQRERGLVDEIIAEKVGKKKDS